MPMRNGMSGMIKQQVLHKKLAETAANTFTSERIEIPNTQNATAVKLDRVFLQADTPENVAATLTEVNAQVGVTDCKAAMDAAAAIDASVAGVVAVVDPKRYTTSLYGDRVREAFPNRAIGKNSDGKYYVVVAIKGENNVAVKNINVTMEFTVL